MSYHFKLEAYEYREEVYHEDDDSDYIYFVRSGEFEMIKHLVRNDFNSLKFRNVPLKL